MFMISESMRIGVATGHVPLKDVSEMITVETHFAKNKADEPVSYYSILEFVNHELQFLDLIRMQVIIHCWVPKRLK